MVVLLSSVEKSADLTVVGVDLLGGNASKRRLIHSQCRRIELLLGLVNCLAFGVCIHLIVASTNESEGVEGFRFRFGCHVCCVVGCGLDTESILRRIGKDVAEASLRTALVNFMIG